MAKNLDHTKLFDFMKILFEYPDVFKKLKPYEKARHFFMCQRFMSIQHPVQANYLQHTKTNPSEVMNFWHDTMTRLYSKVPGWMYIKTAKAKAKAKKSNANIKEATIEEYCHRFGYSKRQVRESIEFFGDKMIDELLAFEKMFDI